MTLLTPSLHDRLSAALMTAGATELAAELEEAKLPELLSSTQAAKMLGVSSTNTIKNWFANGAFPGAQKTPGGHWKFPLDEVKAMKRRLEEIDEKNRKGDLTPPELGDEVEPPLL